MKISRFNARRVRPSLGKGRYLIRVEGDSRSTPLLDENGRETVALSDIERTLRYYGYSIEVEEN